MAGKRKVPHTYVIIFGVIIFSAILTWIIPAGSFEHTTKVLPDGSSREVIVEGTYHAVEANPQTWQIFSSFFDGFTNQAHIIIFILLIGGAFWIMNASKAIDVGILAFLRFTRKLEHKPLMQKLGINNVVMLLIMFMFSVFGAVFGMSEETIAFVIILIPLAISMGYDSITGLCMVYVAAHLGFAGAVLNPFTIGIAQGLSDLPLFSGIGYRMMCWLVINGVGFSFILWWAHRVKRNPERSPMYHADQYWRDRIGNADDSVAYYTPRIAYLSWFLVLGAIVAFAVAYPSTTMKVGNSAFTWPAIPVAAVAFALFGFLGLRKSVHYYILTLLAFTIIFLIVGVMGYGWYVTEIGTLFFAMGIASGIAMNRSANDITIMFLDGVKDIMSAALVVGLAGGIIVVLQDGLIIDTIMNNLANSLRGVGKTGSLGMMYGIQTMLNILIPSGSAKAALTMPIMAPFSDLIGVSRQATVMAFQFGDGFTNMITPTSGVLIGALGVARIPYEKWFRWALPFIGGMVILGFLLLVPTLYFQFAGF